jgi:uncharacterized membrane protein YbaN (DUF454 family)
MTGVDNTGGSTPIQANIPQVHGAWKILYQALGLFFVGLGWLGAFLPLLPTTPFLLLASFFFLRSSPGLQRWLVRSKIFGPFLLDWQEHGGVRPRVKIIAFAMISVVVAWSLTSPRLPIVGKGALVGLATLGLVVVARLKTIRDADPPSNEMSRNTPPSDDPP